LKNLKGYWRRESMANMDEEPQVKGPHVSWAVIIALALVFAAAVYCHDRPDSFLAHFIGSGHRP
jgi:hypothetical protein